MAEPMFGQDAVAFYLLAEQVSREVKVVQSGQGADEVFGGYFWYPRMEADDRHAAGALPPALFRPRPRRISAAGRARPTPAGLHLDPDRATTGRTRGRRVAGSVLRLDVTTLIVDDPVKRVDNMTMAWGLEARVPFLDHELVELAARCRPN